jgi:hypothetical protein
MCAATDADTGGDDAHFGRRQTALIRSKSLADPRRGSSHPVAHAHGHRMDMGTTKTSNGFRSSSNKFGTTARSSILAEMGMSGERCQTASKQKVWEVFDVFLSMAQSLPGGGFAITRDCFSAEQGPPLTVPVLRVMRKTRIYDRLRSKSDPVTSEEFFRLAWPSVTNSDLALFQQWAVLRTVNRAVREEGYQGSTEDMEALFTALDYDCDGKVSLNEFERGEILEPEEVRALHAKADNNGDGGLTFEEFNLVVKPALTRKFVSPETERQLEEERQQKRERQMKGDMQKKLQGLKGTFSSTKPKA